jgi:hypothetical protein
MGVCNMNYSTVAKRCPLGMLLGVGLAIAATQVASAQPTPPASDPNSLRPILKNVTPTGSKVATDPLSTPMFKSTPDECFYGVGDSRNSFPDSRAAMVQPQCPPGSQPRVNPAYAWGLTQTGSHVWFGTASSGSCLTQEGRQPVNHQSHIAPNTTIPVASIRSSSNCESGSRIAPPCDPTPPQYPLPNHACDSQPSNKGYGDWRPPRIYHYDVNTRKVTDFSSPAQDNLNKTVGIRSAGSTPSIVFLGGLSIVRPGYPQLPCDPNNLANDTCSGGAEGIYLYAFTPTGTFLASTELTQYSDIRRWVYTNGQLYAGVQAQDKTGRVLHWTGTTQSPFQFEEVAEIESDVAYLTALGDQLYATTWAAGFSPSFLGCAADLPALGGGTPTFCSGLWVSPHKPVKGDIAACGNGSGPDPTRCWRKIWDTTLYEPDPITRETLLGGAVEAYNNQIYWGTMQVPHNGPSAHQQAYGFSQSGWTADQRQALYVNTTRATPVFRYNPAKGPDFRKPPTGKAICITTPSACQLLYGDTSLPVDQGDGQTFISKCPTPAGSLSPVCQTAVYGPAGFGQPLSTYMWASSVYQNRLFFGVLDLSYQDAESAYASANPSATPAEIFQAVGAQAQSQGYGADLWRFDSPNGPALAESLTGVGNYLNYGVRNMIADACNLYVGIAGAMNLRTSGTPQGGLEFRVLTSGASCGTLLH